VVFGGIPADNEVSAGNRHLDAYMEELPPPVSTVWAFNNNPTTYDLVRVLLEGFGPLAYVRFNRARSGDIPEGEMQRDRHRIPLLPASYATGICFVLGSFALDLPMVTSSIPSWKRAWTFDSSASSGIVKRRTNFP
jgi:hypothetical protein